MVPSWEEVLSCRNSRNIFCPFTILFAAASLIFGDQKQEFYKILRRENDESKYHDLQHPV